MPIGMAMRIHVSKIHDSRYYLFVYMNMLQKYHKIFDKTNEL